VCSYCVASTPALLISPYAAAGVDATQYEHTSLVATMLELFGLSWPASNQRIPAVQTFTSAIGTTPRTGLPTTLRRPAASNLFTPPG